MEKEKVKEVELKGSREKSKRMRIEWKKSERSRIEIIKRKWKK